MRFLITLRWIACIVRYASSIGLVVVALFWAVSFRVDPWETFVSPSPQLHFSLQRGALVVFNDVEFGPYSGSLLWLDFIGPDDIQPVSAYEGPDWAPRIYWRGFYDPVQRKPLWTGRISLLIPAALLLVLVVSGRVMESALDHAARRIGEDSGVTDC